MRLKNATPEASSQLQVRIRLSEVKGGLYSIPKSEFEKGRMMALIGEALEIAADRKALPELRVDALSTVAWVLHSKQFSEKELQKIEQGAMDAAKGAAPLELIGAVDVVRKAAAKNREKAGKQQTLF